MKIIVSDMSNAFDDRYTCESYNDSNCYCYRCSLYHIKRNSVGLFKNKRTKKLEPLCEDCLDDTTLIGGDNGVVFYDSLTCNKEMLLGDKLVYFVDLDNNLLDSRIFAIISI